MRSSISEMIAVKCNHCNGTGLVKAPSIVSIDILDSIEENIENSYSNKKEFLEIMAREEVINYLVSVHIKEIEDIQRKYDIKIITTKHNFDKNEEYLLRFVEEIGNSSTAIELFHNIATTKAELIKEEKRKTSQTFKPLSAIIGKINEFFTRKH